jgi:hypothetical protein
LSIIGFFAALISVAVATSFTTCGTDELGITTVTLSENPVTPGTDLSVTVTGKPTIDVSAGTLTLNIKVLGITVYTESFDLCTEVGVTCPLVAGASFTATVSEAIPANSPSVTATAQMVAVDGNKNQISCIQVKVSVSESKSEQILSDEAVDFLLKQQFEQYKIKFNKKYSAEEESIRFFHFTNSINRVAIKNVYGGNVFGLTKFSDMDQEEFRNIYLNYKPKQTGLDIPVRLPEQVTLPSAYDWRDHGVVTPVKNQGYCGSCWAFSTAETIESAWAVKGHTLTTFSEQQIVACDTTDGGCNGGDTITAYAYVQKAGGLATEADYPYASSSGTSPACQNFTVSGGQISGYRFEKPIKL